MKRPGSPKRLGPVRVFLFSPIQSRSQTAPATGSPAVRWFGEEMIPRPVAALSHVTVAQISCGHSHCCAVTESGDVWAWGNSRRGRGEAEVSVIFSYRK